MPLHSIQVQQSLPPMSTYLSTSSSIELPRAMKTKDPSEEKASMNEALKVVGECFERMAMKAEKGAKTSTAPATLSHYYAVSADLQKQYALTSVPVAFPVSVAPVALSAVPAPLQNAWPTERVPVAWPLGVESVPGTLVPSLPVPSAPMASVPTLAVSHAVLPAIATSSMMLPVATMAPQIVPPAATSQTVLPMFHTTANAPLTSIPLTSIPLSGFQFSYLGWSRYFDQWKCILSETIRSTTWRSK